MPGIGTGAHKAPISLNTVRNWVGRYGVASGTDTYTVTVTPALTSYTSGVVIEILFTNANTGASTINVNGLGAKAITKNGTTALVANDIAAGQIYLCEYDGTRFQIVSANNAGTGTITGSGTANTYTIFTSSTAIGNSKATQGTTNIFTVTPTASTGSGYIFKADGAAILDTNTGGIFTVASGPSAIYQTSTAAATVNSAFSVGRLSGAAGNTNAVFTVTDSDTGTAADTLYVSNTNGICLFSEDGFLGINELSPSATLDVESIGTGSGTNIFRLKNGSNSEAYKVRSDRKHLYNGATITAYSYSFHAIQNDDGIVFNQTDASGYSGVYLYNQGSNAASFNYTNSSGLLIINNLSDTGSIAIRTKISDLTRLKIDNATGNFSFGNGAYAYAGKVQIIGADDTSSNYALRVRGDTGSAPTDIFDFRCDGNIGFRGQSFGSGVGVFFIADATTVPSTNPTAGGILYCESGALKYRGSSGTVTTIATA